MIIGDADQMLCQDQPVDKVYRLMMRKRVGGLYKTGFAIQ